MIADEAKKQPQRADLKKELAGAEFQAKDYDKAIADFQSILDRYKDAPIEQGEIYERIAIVYGAKKRFQHAVDNRKPDNWPPTMSRISA